jgi:prepilin-type processing-associated H-X9-DG protein
MISKSKKAMKTTPESFRKKATENSLRSGGGSPGFTKIELAATLATVALLAAMLLPTLAENGGDAKAFRCQSNLKRLTVAWQEYAADNNEQVLTVYNWIASNNPSTGSYMNWTNYPGVTNTACLLDSSRSFIAAYVNPVDLIKCPADHFQSAQNPGPRRRSVSMNWVMGGTVPVHGQAPDGKRRYYGTGGQSSGSFFTLSQTTVQRPSMIFLFLDEHPDSITDAIFAFEPGFAAGQESWRDVPGSYHDGAVSLSYADGHAELHKWRDSRTTPPVAYVMRTTSLVVGSSLDYEWMQDRMPYRY